MPYPTTMGDVHLQQEAVNLPSHSTPTRQQYGPHTQLQFNLNPSTNKGRGVQQTYKPRPIIIEKLLPYPTKPECERSILRDSVHLPDTMLSSEKLAFAVQLAKMDIKKLKNMLQPESTEGDVTQAMPVAKVTKKKVSVENEKSKKTKKVAEKEKKEVRGEPRRHIIHLYPEPRNNVMEEPGKFPKKTKTKQPPNDVVATKVAVTKDNEIKRLHEDLVKYSQTLDLVVQKLSRQKFVEDIKDDEELKKERERASIRAEEHGNRSARTLYMLQRKVEDLHNERSSTNTRVRQTKKSQYGKNLASAHRAAVRTLQSFVKQAPLYYNNTGKLPPMYKALALLIQELTELSSGTELDFEAKDIETIEDLIVSLSRTQTKRNNQTKKVKGTLAHSKHTQDKDALNKSAYLDQRIDWLKRKADELNIKSFREGDGYTPDRASSLRHAIQSLGEDDDETDSKQAPLIQAPVFNPAPVYRQSLVQKRKKQSKSSVLLPNELKKKRMKIPSRPFHPQPPGPMNYAAATVVSKIRKKPPVEKKEKTPPSTPRKSVAFTDEDDEPSTPRKRDQKIIDEARILLDKQKNTSVSSSPRRPESEASPRRPESEDGSVTPTKVKLMEKEIQRERWLEERKSKEISKLDAIEKMNTNWLNNLKNEMQCSNHLVDRAEVQIKERLMPLLEKAREISEEEAKREEHYNSSINRRLAGIASQKAMSEGERLAEYILDDLIQEAAVDIQRIEEDNDAEMEAGFMVDRVNLEKVAQRLEDMEKEEEAIRRRWKCVQYSEMDSNIYGSNLMKENKGDLNTSHNTARSVMFTASSNRRQLPVPNESVSEMPSVREMVMCIPEGSLNTILQYKGQFENYLDKSIHNSWSIHPVDVIDELSEYVLDELLADVSNELNEHCSKFVDDVYEKEFLNVT